MTEPATTEPTKKRSGWHMLGLIVLGMVLLTIGAGFWWYYDDGDLEVVREQARQQGRPLTWDDMMLTLPSAERLRIWKRVTELSAQLKSYQMLPTSLRKGSALKTWEPLPQELLDYHQTLDAAAIAELIDLLDRLGDQPLVLHEKLTFETRIPEIGVTRELMLFMQERMLLADNTDTGVWSKRMLAVCRLYSADSLMPYMARISCMSIVLGSIARRFTELKSTAPSIAADILATTQGMHTDLLRALDGEFLVQLDAYTHRKTSADAMSHALPHAWFMPLITRAGRQGALTALLDAHRELQALDSAGSVAWARATEEKFHKARRGIPYPSLVLQGFYMPAWVAVVRVGQRTALHGRLLAAELQGQPWPNDTFDTTGATLRSIIRDGRVIAGYSVGDDGVDQGGTDKRDQVFPLYAKP